MTLRNAAFILLVVSPLSGIAVSQDRLCVSAVSEHPANIRIREQFGEDDPPFSYSIQIDEGPTILTDIDKGFEYPLQGSDSKRMVKIRNNEKIVESFWLYFDRYEEGAVCLWFQSLYHAWSAWPLGTSRHFCDCDG